MIVQRFPRELAPADANYIEELTKASWNKPTDYLVSLRQSAKRETYDARSSETSTSRAAAQIGKCSLGTKEDGAATKRSRRVSLRACNKGGTYAKEKRHDTL